MKKKAEEIVMEFFKDRFGGLMSVSLFSQYLKKYKINNFDKLTMKQKINFGQLIIQNMYKDFYPIDKINNMKILYLLRFSLNEAVGKVEQMIKKESEVKLDALVNVNLSNSKITLEELEDQEHVKFGFECSGMLEGVLLFMMTKESVLKFSSTMMQVMMGMDPGGKEIDEMKISAIYEFFNILLPDFIKVIANSYNNSLFFTPLYYEDFKKKYFDSEGNFKQPERIMKTKVNMLVNHMDNNGKIVFLFYKASDELQKLISQSQTTERDAFEQVPAKVFVDTTGNVRGDMDTFFGIMGLRSEIIDYLLEKSGVKHIENMDYKDFVKFYNFLIAEYFQSSSDNKRENIRINLVAIMGWS